MPDNNPPPDNVNQPKGADPREPAPPASPPPQFPPPPGSAGFSRRKLIAAIIIAALLLACALILGFLPRWRQRNVAMTDTSQLQIPTVSVVSPAPAKSGPSLMLPAEVRPWREASVYARADGYLRDWVADIGTHVTNGQLLAVIETPDLDQQLHQAQAQLSLTEANLHLAQLTDERWQHLLKTASVSVQEAAEKAAARETAAASVEAARANVQRLEDLVGFQRVVAPFAGVVTIRAVDIGDLIIAGNGGKQLFHIAQTDKLRVYVRVPEPYALDIAPGQTASLATPENPGKEFAAKITTTSEAISPVSRTLDVELEVDNSQNQNLPYSFGEITLKNFSAQPLLTLPSNTLLFRAQGLQVAVVRTDDTVELRSVQVGRDFGQTIEILGGVTETDRVIENPTDSLVSGIKVHIQPPSAALAAK